MKCGVLLNTCTKGYVCDKWILSCKGGMVAQQGFQFNFDCYLAVLEEEKKFNIMMGSLNNSRYFRRILEVIFLTKLEQFVLNRTTWLPIAIGMSISYFVMRIASLFNYPSSIHNGVSCKWSASFLSLYRHRNVIKKIVRNYLKVTWLDNWRNHTCFFTLF